MSHPTPSKQAHLRLHLPRALLRLSLVAPLSLLALATPMWAQSAAERLEYSIPAGPLGTALSQFAAASGVTLSFAPTQIAGLASAGLKGQYSLEEGFARLLANSGFQVRQEDLRRYSLVQASEGTTMELGATNINASGPGAITEGTGSYTTGPMQTATKMALSSRETPQSVSVITRQRMDDQNMRNLEDVLKSTPGVTMTKDGPQRPIFYARGFAVENLMTDGLPNDMSHYLSRDMSTSPDMAIFDRVEVVRGATGLMQGSGSPSAAINLVRKRPTAETRMSVTGSAGSWDNYRSEFDVSGALNANGSLRGRVVAAYQSKDSFQDVSSSERSVFYAISEADFNEDTTLTLGVSNQNSNDNTSWGGLPTAINGGDLHLPRSSYLGNDWEYWDQDNTTLFSRMEYRFADSWKLLLAASKSWSDLDMYGSMTARQGSDFEQFGQYLGQYQYEDQQNSYDAYVTGPFSLFGRSHEMVVGASQRQLTFKGKGNYRQDATDTDIWNPSSNPKRNMDMGAWTQKRESEQKGTYLTTRLNLRDDLKLILGSRLDWYDYDVDTRWMGISSASSRPNKVTRHLTRYAGVVYDLDAQHSVYASYTDIFRPQTELDANDNAIKPIEGKNYEVGIKGEYFDSSLNASVALFRINQENRAKQLDGPACGASSCFEAAGEVRSEGIELELNGALLPGWELGAGYTFAEVKYTKDANPDNVGRLFDTDIPRHVFKAFTTYQLPGELNRWTIGGGLYRQNTIYNQGSNFYGAGSEYRVEQEAYTLIDLMTSYKASDNLNIRLNLNNVFDKKYYQSISTNTYYGNNIYGEPRNAMLTVRWSL